MKNIMFTLSNYHYSQSKVMNNERLYIKKIIIYSQKLYIIIIIHSQKLCVGFKGMETNY